MAQPPRAVFEPADYTGLTLRRAAATAQIHFLTADNDALTVTIPARQLSRLYTEIDRKLRQAPELDARESRKN